jgi:hypothetical protein
VPSAQRKKKEGFFGISRLGVPLVSNTR